jgi:hypothetical protein
LRAGDKIAATVRTVAAAKNVALEPAARELRIGTKVGPRQFFVILS